MTERPGRIPTDPRISRRRKAVARSKRRRMWIGMTASLAIAALIWGMFWSPLLVVRDVRVVGNEHTHVDDVASVAGLDAAGRNLLLLATGEVEDKIETLPWVAKAEIDRMLPGTVRVKITERVPALILSLGAARWTLDAQGYVLASGAQGKNLPVLAGVEVGSVEPGVRLQTSEALAALEVMRALPRSVRDQVAGIFAPTIERITLSLSSGTAVRYGAAEGMGAKNEVLKALLARLRSEGRRAAYIDVRVPTSPAVSDAPPASPDGGATPTPTPTD